MDMAKKDKKYIPAEFKGITNRGEQQIGIGLICAVLAAALGWNPFLIFGGLAWALFGLILLIRKKMSSDDSDIDYDKDIFLDDSQDKEEDTDGYEDPFI